MDFREVVETRRSVRSYSDEPVAEDALERVLDGARMAPSANNVQPWEYIVVRDDKMRRQVAKLSFDQSFIAEAPVVIVCCGRRYHDHYSWIADNMYLVDCTISFDHLTLAARNEGLGTCWIGAFDNEALKKLLGVPEGYDIIMLTPLGHPASSSAFHKTSSRKPREAMVHDERF